MIDTYNQFPGAHQIAVVGMRLFKQQNISYVVDGHCFRNQEAPNKSHVLATQECCQPTVMKVALSSNGLRLSRIFIIHGKAIDKMAWQTPALL
jgi:hypothetical protein